MKRVLLLFVLSVVAACLYSQKSIDALFDKYAGKDGFTTFTINGNLLKLISCLNDEHEDNQLPVSITELRILTQEDHDASIENFYDVVIKGIDLDNYEEFMRVKEKDQDLRMLVRAEGKRFKEFLLVAGGEDNVIIQLKGDMTFAEAKKFSANASRDHRLYIPAEKK